MKKFLIKKLGGFPTIEDAINELKKIDDLKLKHEILTEAVKHLFNTIDADDILHKVDGVYFFEGKPLMETDLDAVKEEASMLLSGKLWKILMNDVKFQLNKKMFIESSITYDVMWGKLLIYFTDILNKRLRELIK